MTAATLRTTVFAASAMLVTLPGAPALAQDCMLGEIRAFGGNFAPRHWAFLDGQSMQISDFAALYAILGSRFGGDDRTFFKLPDMRGRVSMHDGQGPGLSDRVIGQMIGTEQDSVEITSVAPHTHPATTAVTIHASSDSGNANAPAGNVLADDGSDRIYQSGAPDVTLNSQATTATTTVDENSGHSSSDTVSTIQPSIVISHIMCIDGYFPSRN